MTAYAETKQRCDAHRRVLISEGRVIGQQLVPILDRRTVGKMLNLTPQAVEQIECLALRKVAQRLKAALNYQHA